jgi:hypothetical protein
VTASNWKFVVLLLGIFACAVTGWLAATDQSIASDDLKYIKSITFAGHTVDPPTLSDCKAGRSVLAPADRLPNIASKV